MKKMINFAVMALALVVGGSLYAAEYGENDYNGAAPVVAEQPAQFADSPSNSSNVATESGSASEEGDVKCFLGRRRSYGSYYYYPTYYYYRPVYYYSTWYYYTYRCSYICFYKSLNAKSATSEYGFLINQDPAAGTALSAQKIIKGDVITSIDGKPVTHPSQIEKITADSKLQVIRADKTNNTQNAQTITTESNQTVPAAEYGADQY